VTVTNSPALNIVGANKQKMALTYGDDQVVGTRRQTGAATIDNSDMMFVGYGINAPERYWNDYAGANHYRTNYYRTITRHPSTNDRSSSRLLILVDWMIEAYGKHLLRYRLHQLP
jgi:hypothetical protein